MTSLVPAVQSAAVITAFVLVLICFARTLPGYFQDGWRLIKPLPHRKNKMVTKKRI